MMKTIIVFTILLGFLSCTETTSRDENTKDSEVSQENINTEKEKEIDNFPIVSYTESRFENIKEFDYDGPSFNTTIKMINKSGVKINSFQIRYFIETKLKDGTFFCSPFGTHWTNESANKEVFDHPLILKTSLQEGEIWQPNEEKQFKLVVNGTIGLDLRRENFSKELFQRTPESVSLYYQYKAIGIDGEYTNSYGRDILEYWKEYQTQIGLR